MLSPFSAMDKRCRAGVTVDPSDRGRNKRLKKSCACFAKLVFNGTPMCLRHAQQAALNSLMEGHEHENR